MLVDQMPNPPQAEACGKGMMTIAEACGKGMMTIAEACGKGMMTIAAWLQPAVE